MTQADQIKEIYSHLPLGAQREVLDFMLFLQGRYSDVKRLDNIKNNEKSKRSIRDNPAFGMWDSLQGDSRELLNQIRQKQWTRT
jgi:hypothetical protein